MPLGQHRAPWRAFYKTLLHASIKDAKWSHTHMCETILIRMTGFDTPLSNAYHVLAGYISASNEKFIRIAGSCEDCNQGS